MTREEKYICLALGLIVYMKHKEVKLNNVFKEQDHPRDEGGRFTDGGGESGSKFSSLSQTLGKEYKDVKGQDAINFLMKEKQGWVRDAFTRKDIGDIALIWGNDDMGLQHIIKRRKETNQPLGKLLSSLADVIEKGEFEEQLNGRYSLSYKGKIAIIEPKLLGNKLNFVFTAFYEK